jgi:hypothetical protein
VLAVGGRADAARRLHPSRGGSEHGGAYEVGTDHPAACAVQVDEVDQLRARVAVAPDEGQRVGTAIRDLLVVALSQPDGVAAEQIDGGDDGQLLLICVAC